MDSTGGTGAAIYLSGEAYVTISVLPPLLKGLQKSTKKTSYESAAVNLFQIAAEQQMESMWESESAFKKNGQNVSINAAALEPPLAQVEVYCQLMML